MPPRYRGLAHALATVWREEGGRGLWTGSAPAVCRAALVNLGELAAYSHAKQAVVASGLTGGDNAGAHAAASLVSGFVASVVSTPADVVKTRLMNQASGVAAGSALAGPRYRGMADCFAQTLRAEGWRGLYKGCGRAGGGYPFSQWVGGADCLAHPWIGPSSTDPPTSPSSAAFCQPGLGWDPGS